MTRGPTRLYNPLPDGLGAQVWECLRRNSQFRLSLANLLRGAPPVREAAHRELFANVFSGAVADAVTKRMVVSKIVGAPWPVLPDQLRDILNGLADIRKR